MRHLCDPAGFWLAGMPRGRPPAGPPPANLPPVTGADSVTVFAATPTIIDVLANDIDPEGGPLTLVSATAVTGAAEVLPDGRLLYTPPPGFTGPDSVDYVAADAAGAESAGLVTITVPAPLLSISPNADGTLTVQAATGALSLTVTSPPEFAGSYLTDTALLAGGPVNLVPPLILGDPAQQAELVAQPGLWIHEGEVTGETWSWHRDGTPIPGATAPAYALAAPDAGGTLTAVQTLTTAAGSRSAESGAVAVPASFSPEDDAGVVAWFDASEAPTITPAQGPVTAWASKVGPGSLAPSGAPTTGLRSIAGLNVVDFGGSARMTGDVTLPAGGNMALHALIAIDAVTNAFAAPISMRATRDFQFDAATTPEFTGRLNVAGIGQSVTLQGGPYAGTVIVSIVFDLTGAGLSRVFMNGTLAGTGGYSTPLDAVQTLGLMTNRALNATFDGAVGEVIVTGTITNVAEYVAYLGDKWGIV